jgi:hypothetical protein
MGRDFGFVPHVISFRTTGNLEVRVEALHFGEERRDVYTIGGREVK